MDTFMHTAEHDYAEQDYVEFDRDCDIQESCNEQDENLLTNFDKEDRPLYEKAIAMSGEVTIFIRDEAYDVFGNLIPECNALCCTEQKPYTAFWKCLETVKETV